MLPDKQMRSLTTNSTFNLSAKDAKTLIVLDDGERLDYYQTVYGIVEDRLDGQLPAAKIGRTLGNWWEYPPPLLPFSPGRRDDDICCCSCVWLKH
jgi:hypothetical protein